MPPALELANGPGRVVADLLRSAMGAEARVPVDRILREVAGDGRGVTRIERLVVGADVVADGQAFTYTAARVADLGGCAGPYWSPLP